MEKDILIRLLRHFYYSGAYEGLCWGLREDVTIADLDKKLEEDIKNFIAENPIKGLAFPKK